MAGFPKFQTKEVLNKVLNSGEDALKVDIDNVTLKTEGSDIDNSMHTALIDYVKFRLYQDRAGTTSDGNIASVAMTMARAHENKYNELTKRYGMKKRDKTGAPRS